MQVNRREIGRKVAEIRARRRVLLGGSAIRAELEQLDEEQLGRRRFASEERRHARLLLELDDVTERA